MEKTYLTIVILFAAFLLQSCVTGSMNNPPQPPKKLPRQLTSNEKALISSGNKFSYNIFHHVVEADSTQNVFISPLSISMALGMTLNGAADETKAGTERTLGMSSMKLHAINKSYKSLIKFLVNLDPKVKINIANSLWSRKGFPIEQSFKDSLQTYFNARAEALDFDDSHAKDVINRWVKKQTNGRIKKIISSRIPSNLMLYLINATYFKGNWRDKFDPEDTQQAPFHLEDGTTVQVNMMSRDETSTPVFYSDKVNMVQLAYADSLYQMDILMPTDPKTSIDQFIQHSLTASNVSGWIGQLHPEGVMIKMPKFKSSYKKKLNDILKEMGMAEAFNPNQADFSNINPHARSLQLHISEVMQKANITVDEKGTEAAAVTSTGFEITALRMFKVDRPFVYMIRERASGTILFMGVMRNPEE